MNILMSLFVGLVTASSPDARAWETRQDELKVLAKTISKTLSQNSRTVRKGNENPRVESLVSNHLVTTNKRLRSRGLYLWISENNQAAEKRLSLTGHEIQHVLASMDPYRREFAENALLRKNLLGHLLTGRSFNLIDIPTSLENKKFFDLETFKGSGDRKFDGVIHNLAKRAGNEFYVVILPVVDLPDSSFSASPSFTVEQLKDGSLNIYQERFKNPSQGLMAAQVYSTAPRNLLFVSKSDLSRPLLDETPIRSYVLNAYKNEDPIPPLPPDEMEADFIPQTSRGGDRDITSK